MSSGTRAHDLLERGDERREIFARLDCADREQKLFARAHPQPCLFGLLKLQRPEELARGFWDGEDFRGRDSQSLADLAPNALGRRDYGVSRARHQRKSTARAADAPTLVRLGVQKKREVVDGEDGRRAAPQRHVVVRPVEESEAAARDIERQPHRPPVTRERAHADARRLQVSRKRFFLSEVEGREYGRVREFELVGWRFARERACEFERVVADARAGLCERDGVETD